MHFTQKNTEMKYLLKKQSIQNRATWPLCLILIILLPLSLWAAKLTHGPVVGAVTHQNAVILARTDASSRITFHLSPASDLQNPIVITTSQDVQSSTDFTVKAAVENLDAGTTYYID